MLWRGMRGRTKEEIHKELQEIDPMSSPHKEEKVIGRNIDVDLLSLFPQRYARIMGGIERWASFPRSTMEGESIYTPSHKNGHYRVPGRIICNTPTFVTKFK
jgi:hypothetical protein